MIIQEKFEFESAKEVIGDAEDPLAEDYEMASSFPCTCLSCGSSNF